MKSVRIRNQWLFTLVVLAGLGLALLSHLHQRKQNLMELAHRDNLSETQAIERGLESALQGLRKDLLDLLSREEQNPADTIPSKLPANLSSSALIKQLDWLSPEARWLKGTRRGQDASEVIRFVQSDSAKLRALASDDVHLRLIGQAPELVLIVPKPHDLGGQSAWLVATLNKQALQPVLSRLHVHTPLQVELISSGGARTFEIQRAEGLRNASTVVESQIPLLRGPLDLRVEFDASSALRDFWQDAALLTGLYVILLLFVVYVLQINHRNQTRRQAERERSLKALQDSEERLKLATQGAGIGVWEYVFETDTVQWDETMCNIYGTAPTMTRFGCAEWLGHIAVQDRERIRSLFFQHPKADHAFDVQFRIRRQSDGTERQIKARARCFIQDHTHFHRMVGVNQDVSEQREFERLLKEAEDRFRSAFESAAVGMAIFTLDGSFVQVNPALAGILGYTGEELLKLNLDQVTHPQDLITDERPRKELLSGLRESYQQEKRFIHQNGHVIWALISVSTIKNERGQNTHFISQIQNISERKKSEAALIEREHFLRTLSECLPGLVSYWGRDLRCHFANKNYEQWTGLPMSKLRGIHMRQLLGDHLYSRDQKHVQEVLGGEAQRFERRKRKPDGSIADTLVHFIPDTLYGHVEGFFALSTDITELKTQQRELERMNNQLLLRTDQAEAASKAKSTFLANMSHEIRTPMNAIMGLLQLIGDSDLNPEQQSYLNKIGSAADVLLNVLNDVLDLSRVEANKLELDRSRFNLDELLGKTMDLFSYRAEEKNIRLYCTKSPECPVSLMGDRLRLAQILNNLLSNALKFTDQGHIHLEVKALKESRLLEFRVHDTGSGMSPEQAALLFQPFSQVDSSSSRRFGGAGLGLSICKSLSELMGGEIHVESEVGKGSSFVFTIENLEPSYVMAPDERAQLIGHEANLGASASAEVANLSPSPALVQALQGLKVLVADDHKLNRLVAGEMIRKSGGQVTLANDGQEAIDACKTERFDAILMDLQMPTVDGFEATAQILSLLGEHCPPIIALTASATEKDRQNILAAGMREHLVKPFQKEDLLRILKEQTAPSAS